MIAERAAWRKAWTADPTLVRLTRAWLERSADLVGALRVAQKLALPGTADWAVRVVKDTRAPALTRAQALILLGQTGNAAHRPIAEALLKDTTAVGSRTLGKATLQAELRDVALATTIRLSGQDPARYGFPYLLAIPGLKVLPSAACLGFRTPAERARAFEEWGRQEIGGKKP